MESLVFRPPPKWSIAMIARSFRITSVITLALTVTGCASQRYTVVEPPSKPLTNYSTLVINDFTTNLNDQDSADMANDFADRLLVAVMDDRARNPGESIFDEVVRQSDSTDRVLELDGTIISFEKGSQAKRYFIGFGSGKAYITIQSVFTDRSTGEEILKTNFDGELAGGIFGGAFSETVDAVVRAYIAYFDDYFEKLEAQ
jgi:hypothetical protein